MESVALKNLMSQRKTKQAKIPYFRRKRSEAGWRKTNSAQKKFKMYSKTRLLRAKALTKIKRMHGSYGTDKKAIESAKINLQQAVEGKSLKVLKNEIANIKANPKISEILKKEVGKAEMVLRNKTDELINALQSAMDDTSNPNQKENLERVLDDITAVGIEGHDEKIQHAVDKLVHLEHLKKLEAMVSGLSQRTIARIKSLHLQVQCLLT